MEFAEINYGPMSRELTGESKLARAMMHEDVKTRIANSINRDYRFIFAQKNVGDKAAA